MLYYVLVYTSMYIERVYVCMPRAIENVGHERRADVIATLILLFNIINVHQFSYLELY